MKITEIFKLPLKVDNNYIFDDNNQMIYQFTQSCPYLLKKTIENRLIIPGCNEITSFQLEYRDGTIYIDECTHDTAVIDIRAWGYLTSPNCCGFTDEQAIEIQDKLGQNLIEQLTTGNNDLIDYDFPFELSKQGKINLTLDNTTTNVEPYVLNYLPNYNAQNFGRMTRRQREENIVDIRREPKYQRNKPCPCNSGKKYKHCCINKQ